MTDWRNDACEHDHKIARQAVADMAAMADKLAIERRRSAKLMILAGALAVLAVFCAVGWFVAAHQPPIVIREGR